MVQSVSASYRLTSTNKYTKYRSNKKDRKRPVIRKILEIGNRKSLT